MNILDFIKEQIGQLETNKRIDMARTEGFYQGARQALGVVADEIAKRDETEKVEQDKKKSK